MKFKNFEKTATGEARAYVHLTDFHTLWFNTGTLCNLSCENCYIESSPRNDSLLYLGAEDVRPYLKEIQEENYHIKTIGLTGGEPFINPHIIDILESILEEGFTVLVLTNAYKILHRHKTQLKVLQQKYTDQLQLRVSLDHYTLHMHEKERGRGTFEETLKGIKWLVSNHFHVHVAGRSLTGEDPHESLEGFTRLFVEKDIKTFDNSEERDQFFVIFPEMQESQDVPEITTKCWGILKKSPDSVMCASSRMVVKRKGTSQTTVLPCTLITKDRDFDLGPTLKESHQKVWLKHPYCAEFCVLGGASCSS